MSSLFAQFDLIGRKINPNLPRPILYKSFKSVDSIPSLNFQYDSIRQLKEITTGNGEVSDGDHQMEIGFIILRERILRLTLK